LGLGAIYALIALGYTMVYGVLRFINFAHSDVLMLGAFSAFYITPKIEKMMGPQSVFGCITVFFAAAAICAILGMTIERLAYRPLRNRPKLTVLITAIGVSLLIEYTGQNEKVLGSAPQSFPKLVNEHSMHLGNVVISSNDLLTVGVTAVLLVIMWFVVQKTLVGTAMRAVSVNQQAAVLMGVPVNRIISFTFGIGSALAAVAGLLYSIKYPSIDPLMGVQPGLKAFVAAVLGGIGNLPGAVLGGVIIGLLETFAGGDKYLSNYRDAIAFGILILILLFKPAGLLGRSTVEKV
ncbi:MAG: branched-chain amino acid ABC transporter permease, partial [Opitutaceae bacterium]|nr:branched-chain amino acid ABC transporter permease [Verrucomicrobiales bacterium]